MKIYNAFGIKPTNTFTSAGSDYYIPNIISPDQTNKAYKAFEKSYNKTQEEISFIVRSFNIVVEEKKYVSQFKTNIPNLVHLYLALYDYSLEQLKKESIIKSIYYFLEEFVVFDVKRNVVGIKIRLNDTLFINSGIKISLDTVLSDQIIEPKVDSVNMLKSLGIGIAGLYVNKSGMGNKGFDVRACLVDEDYTGFVHLSMAYTKELIENGQNIIYCGDKLTQMMLIPVFHTEYEECSEENYNKLMEDSNRGDAGFGSSDIKH